MIQIHENIWIAKDSIKEIHIEKYFPHSDFLAVGKNERGKEIILYSHKEKENVKSWIKKNFGENHAAQY